MKTIFLLGASKGIGFGIAKELVKRNIRVYIGSRNQEKLESAAKILNELNKDSCFYNQVDISSYESLESWFNKGISLFKDFDGLLINSGGPPAGKFLEFHDKDWYNTFEFMLMNPIRLLRMAYPYLNQRSSSVLVVTSYAVKEPVDNLILSNVFRSGITGLIKTLSREWAPQIRLNCIMPGRIDTDRIRQLDQSIAEKQGKTVEQVKDFFTQQIPLKRYGTIEEIGKLGAFLLTDDSSYITGSSIAVDGGIIHTLL